MPRFSRIKMLAVIWFLNSACWATQVPGGADEKLSPAEEEFVTLTDDFNSELNKFWKQISSMTDRGEIDTYVTQHDPAIEYLPKLLAFEREHAGQDVGIDTLSEVISYAARGGGRESPGALARREVLPRLVAYEDRELVIRPMSLLTSGDHDRRVIDHFRRVAISRDAHPTVRETARFVLAKELLSLRDARLTPEQRLKALAEGEEPTVFNETDLVRDYLNSLPSAGEINSGINEATTILTELAASGTSFRLPVIRTVDPTGRIARIDPQQAKSATDLSEMAAALLFKEQHLRIEQPAPNLELKLVDGELWTLESQRGRVVIIQFSFTGCRPCEMMYPDLRKLHEENPKRVSIVSIMRDETPNSSTEAINAGKITWAVAWDGRPGRIASRWSVDVFPTVYVIDRKGRVAGVNLQDEKLKAKVTELLEMDPR